VLIPESEIEATINVAGIAGGIIGGLVIFAVIVVSLVLFVLRIRNGNKSRKVINEGRYVQV
jgi:hypothetical protein